MMLLSMEISLRHQELSTFLRQVRIDSAAAVQDKL